MEKTVRIFQKIIGIICENNHILKDKMALNSNLKDDLNLGADDIHNICAEVQQYFNIKISEEEAKNLKTIQDLVFLIEVKIA